MIPDRHYSVPAALLFDLDGTLFDHASAVSGALEEIHATYAPEIARDRDAFRDAWICASSRGFDRFTRSDLSWAQQGRERVKDAFGRPDLEDDAADRLFATYVEAYERRWALFPDALPCLERLHGHSMALVTNGHPQQQRKKLRRLGLDGHFQAILISGEVGAAKPSPGIFLEASRRLGSRPGDCLVVGDSWRDDVEGSLGAGMQPVWLDRQGQAASACSVPAAQPFRRPRSASPFAVHTPPKKSLPPPDLTSMSTPVVP